MTTLTATERTQEKAPRLIEMGDRGQGRNGLAGRVYHSADERVKTVLAIELLRIERELEDSLSWTHEGFCDCDQCLYELSKQRKLCAARQRVLSELATLNEAGGV